MLPSFFKTKMKKQQKHHLLYEARGEFDEMFVRNASVHIERMSETSFWIGIYPSRASGLPGLMLNTGVCNGEWFFNIEEDCVMDSKSISVGKRLPRA